MDLGAEQLIGAEREGYRIAVEIKSFLTPSPIHDLEQALVQFVLYSKILKKK
ncbi:MAG: element excision factor XisH family protein, partial [Prochlorotrichaceae cyanobacterium]